MQRYLRGDESEELGTPSTEGDQPPRGEEDFLGGLLQNILRPEGAGSTP